uniref:Uncharacterized protein n=1 Tax=Anguilla anguilla TaxID=7936 RepID=A0A0E9Q6N6_ANGAN
MPLPPRHDVTHVQNRLYESVHCRFFASPFVPLHVNHRQQKRNINVQFFLSLWLAASSC